MLPERTGTSRAHKKTKAEPSECLAEPPQSDCAIQDPAIHAAVDAAVVWPGNMDTAAAAAYNSAALRSDLATSPVEPAFPAAETNDDGGSRHSKRQAACEEAEQHGYIRLSWWAGLHHDVADAIEAEHGHPHIIWGPNAGDTPLFTHAALADAYCS